jgi:hypothetical protein
MKWYDIKKTVPKDDENVFVVNNHEDDFMVTRAYYDVENNSFYSIESRHSFPLDVTHWMRESYLEKAWNEYLEEDKDE